MGKAKLLATCVLVTWVALAGCGSSSTKGATSSTTVSKNFPAPIEQLISQARQEGHLKLLWSAEFLHDGRDLGNFQSAFNKYFGLNIKMSYTAGASMPQVASEIVQAAKAGTPAPTDVWMDVSGPLTTLLKDNATKPYPWASLENNLGVSISSQAVAQGNVGLAFGTNLYAIYYNSKKISASQAPKSYQQLLNANWRGSIATNEYASGLYQLAASSQPWGYQKTESFVTKFATHIRGLIRCGDVTGLLSGQYDIIAPECSTQAAIFARRKGEPIGYVIPSDGPVVDGLYVGVSKTAQDPAAAALLTLFMDTPEGQQLSWQDNAYDLWLFPGSHSAQVLKSVEHQGTHVAVPSDYNGNPQITKYQKQFISQLTHPSK